MYAACLVLLWRNVKNQQAKIPSFIIYLIAVTAVMIHAYALYQVMHMQGDIAISVGAAISMAGWISAVVYLLLALKMNIEELGLIVYPLSILSVIGILTPSDHAVPLSQFSNILKLHILVSIPAYGVLFMAFAQACLLKAQDRSLRKGTGRLIGSLPPIQSMETYLFFLTGCGFGLMTLNLILGFFTSQDLSGKILGFTHHAIFVLAAWAIFALTIAGKLVMGWRGEFAAKWTMLAFCLLFLSYFGTRFVNELISI